MRFLIFELGIYGPNVLWANIKTGPIMIMGWIGFPFTPGLYSAFGMMSEWFIATYDTIFY